MTKQEDEREQREQEIPEDTSDLGWQQALEDKEARELAFAVHGLMESGGLAYLLRALSAYETSMGMKCARDFSRPRAYYAGYLDAISRLRTEFADLDARARLHLREEAEEAELNQQAVRSIIPGGLGGGDLS